MSKQPNDNPVATVGCAVAFTAIVIVAIIYGKLDLSGWLRSNNRFQIVTTISNDPLMAQFGELHNTFKIDTATGKTWIYHELTTQVVPPGASDAGQTNRWVEVMDTPAPTPHPLASQQ